MVEVSEFNQRQEEEAAKRLAEMKTQQRKIWSPEHLFDRCCINWLVYGAFGCQGGCGQEHPRITLDYNAKSGSTARLSHLLDPFVACFDHLCRQKQAKKSEKEPQLYYLNEFLEPVMNQIQQKAPATEHSSKEKHPHFPKFGVHLVRASPTALAASHRAHERQLEEEEFLRRAKKQKPSVAIHAEFLEQVLEICTNHNLSEHLDTCEIAFLRLTCKSMAKSAARMARLRLQQVQLSCSVLVDGEGPYWTMYQNLSSAEKEGVVEIDMCRYRLKASNVLMMASKDSSSKAIYNSTQRMVPEDSERSYKWRSSQQVTDDPYHLVRVYLAGREFSVERELLPEELEIARYKWKILDPSLTERRVSCTTCLGSMDVLQNWSRGSFRIKHVEFGFADLLGIYARKKLPKAKTCMLQQRNGPITPAEKTYVKALAKLAREAPGSVDAFRGMQGW